MADQSKDVNAQSPSSLYELVLAGPGTSTAQVLRWRLADEAISDPGWRAAYDDVLDNNAAMPEKVPGLALAQWQQQDQPSAGQTRFGADWGSPQEAAQPLRDRALQLNVVPLPDVADLDLAAAAVALEVWGAALAVDDLGRAASQGIDAIGALSAVMARACGDPVPVLPTDPEPADPAFLLGRLLPVLEDCWAWLTRTWDTDDAHAAVLAAASDLAYHSGGGTLTHQAALLTGHWRSTRG